MTKELKPIPQHFQSIRSKCGVWHLTSDNKDQLIGAFSFPFTDRDSYIQWRKEWKSIYKQLTQIIRIDKALSKEIDRSGGYYNMKSADRAAIDERRQHLYANIVGDYDMKHLGSQYAFEMMLLLEAGKQKSRELRANSLKVKQEEIA